MIASQINECNQIILTEMIINDVFSGASAEEIAALLSIFADPDKTDDETTDKRHSDVCKESHILSSKFIKIEQIVKFNISAEENMNFNNQNFWTTSYNFADAAFSWVKNEPYHITAKYMGEMHLGLFCKNMIKINNLAKDMIQFV